MQPFIWDSELGRHVAISALLDQREALLKVAEAALRYWENKALNGALPTEEEYFLRDQAREAVDQLKAAYPPDTTSAGIRAAIDGTP